MILRDFPAFYWFQFDAFFILLLNIFSDDLAGQLN